MQGPTLGARLTEFSTDRESTVFVPIYLQRLFTSVVLAKIVLCLAIRFPYFQPILFGHYTTRPASHKG